MTYLDVNQLQAIDPASFRAQTPYPWVNPAGLLTSAGYDRLRLGDHLGHRGVADKVVLTSVDHAGGGS